MPEISALLTIFSSWTSLGKARLYRQQERTGFLKEPLPFTKFSTIYNHTTLDTADFLLDGGCCPKQKIH